MRRRKLADLASVALVRPRSPAWNGEATGQHRPQHRHDRDNVRRRTTVEEARAANAPTHYDEADLAYDEADVEAIDLSAKSGTVEARSDTPPAPTG